MCIYQEYCFHHCETRTILFMYGETPQHRLNRRGGAVRYVQAYLSARKDPTL